MVRLGTEKRSLPLNNSFVSFFSLRRQGVVMLALRKPQPVRDPIQCYRRFPPQPSGQAGLPTISLPPLSQPDTIIYRD